MCNPGKVKMRGNTKREDPLVLLPSGPIQCDAQILGRVVHQVLSSSTPQKFLQSPTDDDDHILDETHF